MSNRAQWPDMPMDTIRLSPLMIVDFRSPRSLEYAARRVQRALVANHRATTSCNLPMFVLVQQKKVPSQREIIQGLTRGLYQEYL